MVRKHQPQKKNISRLSRQVCLNVEHTFNVCELSEAVNLVLMNCFLFFYLPGPFRLKMLKKLFHSFSNYLKAMLIN